MNGKEPPCGGRTLEKAEDKADLLEQRPTPSDNTTANTETVREAKHRSTRKRRKPFVL